MKLLYYHHTHCLLHDMGAGHPESPERLRSIENVLSTSSLATSLIRREAPVIERCLLEETHAKEHVSAIFSAAPQSGRREIDPDTSMNAHSLEAALRAAGAGVDAVKSVLSGEVSKAFCAVRPPGHHAEFNRAMGFCLFNNVAVAARYALNYGGLQKIAIVDFDVHHGNGTEDIFRDDPRVLFCSSFQHPFYPYAGTDTHSDHIANVPLPAGTGGEVFRQAISEKWFPAIEKHEPELILISAGFDAHHLDPLASLNLEEADYAWVTTKIVAIAKRFSRERIVSMLEGGYQVDALARCVEAHLKALCQVS